MTKPTRETAQFTAMNPDPRSTTDRGGRRTTAVLITGAAGEVGHGLMTALNEAGQSNIVALDVRELPRDQRELCQETFVGDICDSSVLKRMLAMYEITEVFHLAALLSTRAEFTPETAHEVNVNGTVNLLNLAAEQARSHGQRVRFIFPSSIAVYGLPSINVKNESKPVREVDYCRPITMYGCNKLYCENLGRYYSRFYRLLAQDRVPSILDFRAIRFPGLISAETLPSGGTSDFAPEMIHAAADGKPYCCFVRPDSRIPYMTMPDAIDAMLTLASADEAKLTQCVYNVSSFNPSAGEIAELTKVYYPNAEITFDSDEPRQQIVDSWPASVDDSAARKDWGYSPMHDMNRAFEEYLVPNISVRYS